MRQLEFNPPSRNSSIVKSWEKKLFSASSGFNSDKANYQIPRPSEQWSFKKLKKNLLILRRLVYLELSTDLQYRINFIFSFLSTSVWLVTELLFLKFFLGTYQTLAGWNIYEMACLVAVNQLWVGGVFYLIIWPSCTTFAELIKTGDLDRILTFPISARYYLSVFKLDWTSLSIFFDGIVILVYSLAHLSVRISIMQLLLFILLLLISFWIIYCIQFIFSCITFWAVNAGSYLYIASAIDRLARFPYEIFGKGIIILVFTFILPVTIISNVPLRALMGILDIKFVIYALIVALVLSLISQLIWRKGLRRYESASS